MCKQIGRIVLIAAVAAWSQAFGVEIQLSVPQEAELEARIALQAAQQLSTPETYRQLGFESAGEARKATLGAPFRIFMVRLDKLKAYVPGSDPQELLEDTQAIRYPVYVDNKVRTGVVVRQVDRKWQVESIGRPVLTKALVTAAGRQRDGVVGEQQFLVTIPALGLYFVGHIERADLSLASATNEPQFKIEAGRAVPARELFASLVPYAKQLKTGPQIVD